MREPTRVLAAVAVLVVVALGGCAPMGDASELVEAVPQPLYPQPVTLPDVAVFENVQYGLAGEEPLLLDVCLPASNDAPRPAIVSIHGGSWMRGDKSSNDWRNVCQWLASEGFVAVSVNYRLAPAATFPAQLDDVQQAVRWLRYPIQVGTYNIDPDRIGAFGGSAGGNLAALLGTTGTGDWTSEARVAAVAELSGPTDIRERIPTTDSYNQDFGMVQLNYLGCTDFTACAAAQLASPTMLVDETDPPFFVGHSVDEFIPVSQADTFVSALRAVAVPTTYVTVEGELHSIAMLDDDMKSRIIAFFREQLSPPATDPVNEAQ